MTTMADVKTNWWEIPPTYNNLTDNRTMEFTIAEEFSETAKKLRKLADLMENANIAFIGKLQNNHIKDWKEVINFIEEHTDQLINGLDDIYDRLP